MNHETQCKESDEYDDYEEDDDYSDEDEEDAMTAVGQHHARNIVKPSHL